MSSWPRLLGVVRGGNPAEQRAKEEAAVAATAAAAAAAAAVAVAALRLAPCLWWMAQPHKQPRNQRLYHRLP